MAALRWLKRLTSSSSFLRLSSIFFFSSACCFLSWSNLAWSCKRKSQIKIQTFISNYLCNIQHLLNILADSWYEQVLKKILSHVFIWFNSFRKINRLVRSWQFSLVIRVYAPACKYVQIILKYLFLCFLKFTLFFLHTDNKGLAHLLFFLLQVTNVFLSFLLICLWKTKKRDNIKACSNVKISGTLWKPRHQWLEVWVSAIWKVTFGNV